jgi:hypothetical protein
MHEHPDLQLIDGDVVGGRFVSHGAVARMRMLRDTTYFGAGARQLEPASRPMM